MYVPDAPASTSTLMEVGESTGTPPEKTSEPMPCEDDVCGCTKALTETTKRSISHAITQAKADTAYWLKAASKPLCRRRRCWEVYVGRGRVSEQLRRFGVEVEQFGLQNGWDLTDPDHQAYFLQKMDEDEPDDIWL